MEQGHVETGRKKRFVDEFGTQNREDLNILIRRKKLVKPE